MTASDNGVRSLIPNRPSGQEQIPSRPSHLGSCAGTASLAVAAAIIMLSADLQSLFQLDRKQCGAGEWWRVITGHLAHWNMDHFLWDFVVFVAVGAWCERLDRMAWAICVLVSALLISFVILWTQPHVSVYRGLSGVDSALFSLALVSAIVEWRRRREYGLVSVGVVVTCGFLGKLIYEVTTGQILFVDSDAAGFRPAIEAHVAGAFTGALVAFVCSPPTTGDHHAGGN